MKKYEFKNCLVQRSAEICEVYAGQQSGNKLYIVWYDQVGKSVKSAQFNDEAAAVKSALYYIVKGEIASTMLKKGTGPLSNIRKGRWVPAPDIGDCCYRCSECGKVLDLYCDEDDNYCARCGARMDKERENNG